MRRRLSDRVLRQWLATGRPRWAGRRVESDAGTAARAESMTLLHGEERAALLALVSPPPAFAQRTASGVRDRIDELETLGVIAGLIGLGWETGRALADDPAGTHPTSDDPAEGSDSRNATGT